MKLDKPTSFEIGGVKINIEYTDKLFQDHDAVGQYHPNSNKIVIQNRFNACDFDGDQLQENLLHEITHCILDRMEHKLWQDENFVNLFSRFLNQVIKTIK